VVSKQSAQDRCVTDIAVVSCSDRHAALGNWSAGSTYVELMTPHTANHDTNHGVTESAKALHLYILAAQLLVSVNVSQEILAWLE